MKTIITNLKRASVEMILLTLLSEEDKYGYQMTQEIRARSGGKFTLLEGSMYPILYRLCEREAVTYEEIKVGVHLTRIYYHITPVGLLRLEEMRKTFREQLAIIESLTHFAEVASDE